MSGGVRRRNLIIASMIALGVLAAFVGTASGNHVFTDVSTDAYYHDEVSWLAARGITAGCAPDKFCPNDRVTRGQMAVFLHNMASRTRVGRFACDSYAFRALNSSTSFAVAAGGVQSNGPLACSVHLPDGATVTKLSATLRDNDPGSISCTLFRQDLSLFSGTHTEMVNVTSVGTPGGIRITDPTPQNASIDNNRYSYALHCAFGAQTDDLVLYGATIEYTYRGIPAP